MSLPRWIKVIQRNGKERLVRASEAEKLLSDGVADYYGHQDGYPCLMLKQAFIWRKITGINRFGVKTGIAQMSLVRQ